MKPNVAYLGLTDHDTGQVKVKMLDDLAYLVLSCTTAAYQTEASKYNNMDRLWDTYGHHPKLSVTIFMVKVIQGYEVKDRCLGGVIHVFMSAFRQEHEK